MENDERILSGNHVGNVFSHCTFEICLVVTAWVISGTMAILRVMNLCDPGSYIATEPSYSTNVYETLLLALSSVAIFILFKASGDSTGSRDTQEECFSNIGVFGSKWFLVLLGLLACISLMQPVFESVSIASCFSNKAGSPEILRFILGILKCTFIVSQLLFFVFARGRRCNTAVMSFSVMILVSTNICYIVACMSDGAHQAILMNTYNDSDMVYRNMFCENLTSSLSNGYKVIDTYFQPFMFLFGLYAVQLLLDIWNLFPKHERQFQDTTGDSSDTTDSEADSLIAENNSERPSESSLPLPSRPPQRTFLTRLKAAFCLKLCKYSYILTFVVCLALFISHAVLDTKLVNNNSSKDMDREYIHVSFVWIEPIYENIVGGAAFVGFLFVRREKLRHSQVSSRHILLVLFACFFCMLVVIEMVDSFVNMIRLDKVGYIIMFLIKTFFHFVGVIFQTPFILKSADIQQLNFNSDKCVYLRGLVWVLAICNMELCVGDVFLSPAVLRHAIGVDGDWIGISNWNIISAALSPSVIFYRLQSSLLCIENLYIIKLRRERLGIDSVYQQITSDAV